MTGNLPPLGVLLPLTIRACAAISSEDVKTYRPHCPPAIAPSLHHVTELGRGGAKPKKAREQGSRVEPTGKYPTLYSHNAKQEAHIMLKK